MAGYDRCDQHQECESYAEFEGDGFFIRGLCRLHTLQYVVGTRRALRA